LLTITDSVFLNDKLVQKLILAGKIRRMEILQSKRNTKRSMNLSILSNITDRIRRMLDNRMGMAKRNRMGRGERILAKKMGLLPN